MMLLQCNTIGDTVQCRVYYVRLAGATQTLTPSLAAAKREKYCPLAAPTSTMCTDTALIAAKAGRKDVTCEKYCADVEETCVDELVQPILSFSDNGCLVDCKAMLLDKGDTWLKREDDAGR
jgi:hypothetical protein